MDEQSSKWTPPWESLLAPLEPGVEFHDPFDVLGAFESWAKERFPWMESLDIYQTIDLYGLCCDLAFRSESFGGTCEPLPTGGQDSDGSAWVGEGDSA